MNVALRGDWGPLKSLYDEREGQRENCVKDALMRVEYAFISPECEWYVYEDGALKLRVVSKNDSER